MIPIVRATDGQPEHDLRPGAAPSSGFVAAVRRRGIGRYITRTCSALALTAATATAVGLASPAAGAAPSAGQAPALATTQLSSSGATGISTGSGATTRLSPSALSAPTLSPGPTFVYPQDGQRLDYGGSYMFKVTPVYGASGYLFGFFQNGRMVWENYRDEYELSGTEYAVHPDNPGHNMFRPGPVDVWVRALVDDRWTEATIITIYLR